MLATMVLLGLFAYLLVDLRGTLPRALGSIASIIALFADSEMIDRAFMPEKAEFIGEKELGKIFKGWQFSLGWWGKVNKGAARETGEGFNGREGTGGDDGEDENKRYGRTFGIDVGMANVLGYNEREDGRGGLGGRSVKWGRDSYMVGLVASTVELL
ncbi:hypothetical protein G7Y89_g8794 [Cudoniella acicularis]|uniref:Uncharacterized protein n=1 Tax=Cudoniella acicularis TaxID=354080 RepID=A0A8H4W095_9HELO|nr:hypothetical protein G7Y89_g8794 [Cudoniella acicularis]